MRYRVTWKEYNTPTRELTRRLVAGEGLQGADHSMTEHERVFDDIDAGYEFYQDLQKGRSSAFSPTWEHIDG